VWWSRVPAARTALRRIGDEVDVLTYVSQWCREKIAAALSPQAAGKMVQLSPGVDTERFRPGCGGDEVRRQLGIDEHAAVVVCTARMVRRKGQDTLIRGWRQVLDAHPDARLLLVGDGPDRARLEALAQAEGVSGSTIFVGSVPWREVPSYTDAGDLLAMPCRSRLWGLEPEAFGIVFLEAQACGIPVVVGRSGGAPETLLSPGNGEVVDPRDVDAVASGIARWLTRSGTDEVQPGQISASASGHSWDRSAATLAGLWG
jgi:phosphatidylinositol alpha-1,6-mannosyltransferase